MPRKGNRLSPSQAIENEVYNSLRPVIGAMMKQVDSHLKRGSLRTVREPIKRVFGVEGRKITAHFINRVIQYTRTAFHSATKNFKNKPQHDILRQKKSVSAMESVWRDMEGLIKDLPVLFFEKLDVAIQAYNAKQMTKYGFENRYESLKKQVYTRARTIARDQNNKATELMLLCRCDENNIRKVRWCHSHLSEKPRDYHIRKWDGHTGKRSGKPNGLNGFEFYIDNPPVIDLKTGERGYPAQLYGCKCFLVPVEE